MTNPNQTPQTQEILGNNPVSKAELVQRTRKTFIGILALSLAIPTYTVIRDYALRQELLSSNKNAVVDSNAGNVLCGHNAKVKLDEKIVSGTICGERVRLKESVFKIIESANEEMKEDYKKTPKSGEGSWKYKCIKICESFRTNARQKEIYEKSIIQKFVAAPPCQSFHETAQAVDVKNWYQAQKYLQKRGLVGGTRGIFKDPWHYSKGEKSASGYAGEGMQLAWWANYWLKSGKTEENCPGEN